MEIDFDALRDYLITASSYKPVALIELTEVETASPKKLVEIAIRNNVDLDDFINTISR